MNYALQLEICGALLVVLALIHAGMPRYLNWRVELPRLSLINIEVMKIHTLFIALLVFMIGLMCLTSAEDLVSTTFGKRVCLGQGIFWSVRLLVQFVGYSSELWRGKKFETTVHVIFACFWLYLSWLFFAIYLA